MNIRRREVGLRLALGAMRGQIVRRYFGQGVGVSVVACAAGLALSVLFNRALASMLIGVSSSDPLTLGGVTLVILAHRKEERRRHDADDRGRHRWNGVAHAAKSQRPPEDVGIRATLATPETIADQHGLWRTRCDLFESEVASQC